MSHATSGRQHVLSGAVVVVATAALLGHGPRAAAQDEPHQSSLRDKFGSALGQVELPAGMTVEPRIDAGLQYVSNLSLDPDGESQDEMAGIEAAPGLYAAYSSDRVVGVLDYALIGHAWEDSELNDISHLLDANGRWIALPEWLSVQGTASYGDAVIDPAAGSNYGRLGIFNRGNIVETAATSISPVLRRALGAFEAVASYSYGRTWYLDEPKGQTLLEGRDTRDQGARASFGTREADRRVGFTAYYDWQKTEYEQFVQSYLYERAGLDAQVTLGRGFSLVGGGGVESDLQVSTSEGGLDSDYWNAGLRWSPDQRTLAEARYGQRFFGDSYSVRLNRQLRMFEVDAAYSEDPAVRTRKVSLGEFIPGYLPPQDTGIDFIGFGSDPYLGKNSRVSITAQGSRTRIRLSYNRTDQDYFSSSVSDEIMSSAALNVKRDLASTMSAELNIRYGDFERVSYPEPDFLEDVANYYDTEFTLSLDRELGPRVTTSAEGGYLNRSGDTEYDGWWVALRLRYSP